MIFYVEEIEATRNCIVTGQPSGAAPCNVGTKSCEESMSASSVTDPATLKVAPGTFTQSAKSDSVSHHGDGPSTPRYALDFLSGKRSDTYSGIRSKTYAEVLSSIACSSDD